MHCVPEHKVDAYAYAHAVRGLVHLEDDPEKMSARSSPSPRPLPRRICLYPEFPW
jgi:hypothetical protein